VGSVAPGESAVADPYRGRAAPARRLPTGAPCPECGRPLAGVPISRSTVIVDVCPKHGTWFEQGELKVLDEVYREYREERLDATRPRDGWLLGVFDGDDDRVNADGLFALLREAGGEFDASSDDAGTGADTSSASDDGSGSGSHH
jgi:Zn-finger nucleic acid-binding protein